MYKARTCLALVLLMASFALADPMRPDRAPVTPAEAAPPVQPVEPTLVLTSVYILGEQRQAMINGQWFEEGNRLEQYQIQRIETDRVELIRGNRSRTLRLSTQGSITFTHRED